MNDTSGLPFAGDAVALSGVNLSLGRGAARVHILRDIHVNIGRGQAVGLLGPSGSGKSTLLKTINRLVEADSGTVTIDGEDVVASTPHVLRRRIGYVIQGTGLFPHLTVAANIAIGLRIAGAHDTGPRVATLLELVSLPADFAARMPATLSGGQQQRVGFARALATAPGLMLMDEPFGALDPVTRTALRTSYRSLHDRLALTSIMVTHDMAEALLIADRIVVLSNGRVVADAEPAALLRGAGGAEAQALVAVPRGQAERLGALSGHA